MSAPATRDVPGEFPGEQFPGDQFPGDQFPGDQFHEDGVPGPHHPSLEVFVRDHLALVYRRSLDGRTRTWCPWWWRHPEAVARLDALWRSWEFLRLDPHTGMSVWWRDHLDPHMAVLTDPDGPFRGCSAERGHSERLGELPLVDPPAGLLG